MRAVQAAKAAGGQQVNDIMPVPGGGFAVVLIDPQGAEFGIAGPRRVEPGETQMAARKKFASVPAYVKSLNSEAAVAVARVRKVVAAEVPAAREVISYNILAFALPKPFMYCAGFKSHLGIYPPVRGDVRLLKALAPYSNDKGSLRFPLDETIPWPLVARVAKALAKQYVARATG